MRNKNPGIIFTNHNVLSLPFKIKFDLVIFKNTLHHVGKAYQKEVIENLKKISKQLIIVDIDDPKNKSFKSRIWNKYYVYMLGDQGESFLTHDQFKDCIGESTNQKFGSIKTIKGEYLYSSIVNY